MLTAEIAPEILYHGDEYAIRQMVSILLDNAVKYASDGSPIRLTLEKGKKGPVLRTVNCCEGLTQQQADKLFDLLLPCGSIANDRRVWNRTFDGTQYRRGAQGEY